MNELRFCKPKAVYFDEVKFTIGILEVKIFNEIFNLDNFTHQDLSNLFSNSFSAHLNKGLKEIRYNSNSYSAPLNKGLKEISYNVPYTTYNASRELKKLHTITISVNNDAYQLVILSEEK
jgi:hypothetical protein